MAMVFTTAEQASASAGVKALVYAPAGLGKTVLVSTLPAPVLISAEAGTLSLKRKNLEKLFGVGRKDIAYDIPTIVIQTYEDFVDALNWCKGAREAQSFQSVALDSITEMAEAVLNNAKRTVKDPRQAYGDLIERMETKIREFRSLPKHVYFAAKLEPFKDEMTGGVKYGPSMPGKKLGPALPYFFDEVFTLRIGMDPTTQQSYRYLQTQPDIQYEAKDRSGMLAPIEVPHLGYLFSKILGA
jgi:hypothetical protein